GDWSSDVCSSDLRWGLRRGHVEETWFPPRERAGGERRSLSNRTRGPYPVRACRHRGSTVARELDRSRDRDPARDLQPADRLRQDQQREDRRQKRLQVGEDGGARGPDPADAAEPEQVRDDEGPENGKHVQEPDRDAEAVVLRRELV